MQRPAPPRGAAGQAQAGAAAAGQVWIVAPPEADETQQQAEMRADAAGKAAAAGLDVQVPRRAVAARVDGGGTAGRRLPLLSPRDAQELYSAAHVRPVAVLQLGPVSVRRDPSRDPANARSLLLLEDFVRYKAFHAYLRDPATVGRALAGFSSWAGTARCEGIADPRCLPLHAFTDRGWAGLDSKEGPSGRDAFGDRYGPASRRTADDGMRWCTGAHHSAEFVTVAGTALPGGFHWDVASERGTGRVFAAHEVWRVRQGGYANVTPNGTVRRAPSQRRLCARVWPR